MLRTMAISAVHDGFVPEVDGVERECRIETALMIAGSGANLGNHFRFGYSGFWVFFTGDCR